MSTVANDAAAAAANEAAAENDGKTRGRAPAFDWAEANSIQPKSLTAASLDDRGFWSECDERPSVAMIKEDRFTNEIEYHQFRLAWFERRKRVLLAQFEEKNKRLNDTIAEEKSLCDMYAQYDDIETAKEVARLVELKRKLDAQMEELKNAGHDVNSILAD